MSTIGNILRPLLVAPIQKAEGDLDTYIKALEKGRFNDKICYGISDKKRGFYTLDPVQQPGSLFCGGMGSGKSVSMRFTAATHMAANSKNTFYIYMDALKGMNDYRMLFDNSVVDTSSGVAYGLDDTSKVVPLVDMVHAESVARKEEFSRVGATNIYDYDKKMRKINPNHKDIARIVIFIEEFHALPNSPYVKFSMMVDRHDSIASKLKELMRIGRSYGIFFNFATQRATYDDVPTQLKPGITTMLCFKMNNPGDAAAMNLAHASEISVEQRGRCAYEDGFIQFPYLSDDALAELLRKYYKPFEGQMIKYSVEEFRTALLEDGTSGMVKVKPLSEVVKNWNSFEFKDIVARVLESFSFEKIEPQKNPAYQAEMIAYKQGKKYAIKLAKESKDIGNPKIIEALKSGAKALQADGVFVFCGENVRAPNDPAIKSIDYDDLNQIGSIFDNRKKLEEEETFEEMYMKFHLANEKDLVQTKLEKIVIEEPVVKVKEEEIQDLDDNKIEEVDEVIIPSVKEEIVILKTEEISESKEEVEEYDYLKLKGKECLNDPEFVHKLVYGNNVNVKNLTYDVIDNLVATHKIRKENVFYNYFHLVNEGITKDPVKLKPILKNRYSYITHADEEQIQALHNFLKANERSLTDIVAETDMMLEELSNIFDDVESEEEIQEKKEREIKQEEVARPKSYLDEVKVVAKEQKEKVVQKPVNNESLAKLRERLKKDIESSNNKT